ncbi:putative SOS response-associated peptidase YedK [Novosphingobium sp. PhB57]|uniref:SOS response-associated peptidase n=1 Tax=Novosphingobium sp. PhB57 TaxID=2485107 RepID=UPI0010438FD4|nr:SOS response-associated peptidase family protein [Novosphingobium sp. PhB57]TCU55829.1 putative SOS response-associated peptidase YedK [Novosphingobium sp. PhB57]
MCNLYRMRKATDEIAGLFRASAEPAANLGEEVYPGYPGLVVAEHRIEAMTWGFPLAQTGKRGQAIKPKPINQARGDKLGTAFWRSSFQTRRCLVPFSAWAEPEGDKGAMTRTWCSLEQEDPFAVAGIWRPTVEWGKAFAVVMVDRPEPIVANHGRVPLILAREDWALWAGGDADAALGLCRPDTHRLVIDRTDAPWNAGRIAVSRS